MKEEHYRRGFLAACEAHGMDKLASAGLYKKAQLLRDINLILKGVGGMGRAGASTAKGTALLGYHGLQTAGKGLQIAGEKGSIAAGLPNRILNRLLGLPVIRSLPLLKEFGAGYRGAEASSVRKLGLMAALGLGRGSLIGNTLYGMGNLAKHHPIAGGLAFAAPALWLAKKNRDRDEAEYGMLDTLDPFTKKVFDRNSGSLGYPGLKFDDIDSMVSPY